MARKKREATRNIEDLVVLSEASDVKVEGKQKKKKYNSKNITINALSADQDILNLEKMHPKEVEEYVRTVMRYHNITSIDQKDLLVELTKKQIGGKTEEIVIIRVFEMILDPLSIYYK